MTMMLATPMADQQGHGAQAKEQGVKRGFSVGLGNQGVGRLRHSDPAGAFRVGLVAEQVVHRVDLAVGRLQVDRGGVAVEAQVVLREWEPVAPVDCT
jgi:hypothetical protein